VASSKARAASNASSTVIPTKLGIGPVGVSPLDTLIVTYVP
jgi:hypothetical protein